jgi:flagellin-specific chaperone FliS
MLLKANDALPERPVVIGYYGEPGVRKTSIAHTAENPLLLDFDRGVGRSYGRKDAVIIDNWDEVLKYEREGLYKGYKTIIIDTAKAALDDFLMAYVVRQDFKLQKNKLQAYGAIGEEFKRFLNARREEGADVIIIAHAKKDEDTKKQVPDVTGQSYNLMLRVADQIGFVSSKNNKATIQWYPSDVTVGKNTACLEDAVIPEKSEPSLKTFMGDIIKKVKEAMVAQSEEQRQAVAKSEEIQTAVSNSIDFAGLQQIAASLTSLPQHLILQLVQVIAKRALEFVPAISTVDNMNACLSLMITKPMAMTKNVQDAMKAVQDAKGWKFNTVEKKFFADSAPANNPTPETEKSQELAFS